jgi:hypothetical protein
MFRGLAGLDSMKSVPLDPLPDDIEGGRAERKRSTNEVTQRVTPESACLRGPPACRFAVKVAVSHARPPFTVVVNPAHAERWRDGFNGHGFSDCFN